jgi:hypothetical protein
MRRIVTDVLNGWSTNLEVELHVCLFSTEILCALQVIMEGVYLLLGISFWSINLHKSICIPLTTV